MRLECLDVSARIGSMSKVTPTSANQTPQEELRLRIALKGGAERADVLLTATPALLAALKQCLARDFQIEEPDSEFVPVPSLAEFVPKGRPIDDESETEGQQAKQFRKKGYTFSEIARK